jgi:hypothetical protein
LTIQEPPLEPEKILSPIQEVRNEVSITTRNYLLCDVTILSRIK